MMNMSTQKTCNFMGLENPGKAFITGASSGIGEGFARELAKQGFGLIIVARHKDKLDELANELRQQFKISVEVIAADLTKQEDIQKLANKLATVQDLDVLINNAGFGSAGMFATNNFSRQIDMMQAHMTAPVYLMRSVLQPMIQRKRGFIINLSSFASFLPLATQSMYAATKAFVRMFSESIAQELENTGVKIQALCPGFTRTNFHNDAQLKEMKDTAIPNFMWMEVAGVIKASLAGFRKNKVVVIPGRNNRFMRWFISLPLMGRVSVKLTQSKTKALREE
jgi:short-subunit dehydrogenase